MILAAAMLLLAPAPAGPDVSPAPATLVLPFEPTEPTDELAWVGPIASELLARGLSAAGVPVADRAERVRAQAALELPQVTLTRASWIRVAESLGADRLVAGTYQVSSGQLTLSLRLIDAARASLSTPIVASGPLESLADLAHGLAWDVALAGSAPPAGSRDAFLAKRVSVPLAALKAYGQSLAAHRAAVQLRLVRDAVTIAPDFHEARLTLGQLLRDAGEFSAAFETLGRIPPDVPESRAARFFQGVALLELGRYKEAAALYRSLAEVEATPAVLNNQALGVLRSPEGSRASDLLRKAVDLDPRHTDLHFNLGWALLVEGDAEGAEFHLREAIRREPLDPQARLALAWSLRRKGGEEAEAAWKAVAALAPTFQTLTTPDLGRRFERIEPAERLLDLDRGARSEAEVAAGLVGKAQRLVRSGDLAGALAELTRAAYLDPYANGVHVLLARVHRARGDRELALNELRMALWSHEDPALRAELAATLKEVGRNAEARTEAEKVLKMDPGNETARKILESP